MISTATTSPDTSAADDVLEDNPHTSSSIPQDTATNENGHKGDNDDYEDLEEKLSDETSQCIYSTGKNQGGSDTTRNDDDRESSVKSGSDLQEISYIDSDVDISSDEDENDGEEPLEAARKAKERLLGRRLIERKEEDRNDDAAETDTPDQPRKRKGRNIDLFSLKKRHSKENLFDGKEEDGELIDKGRNKDDGEHKTVEKPNTDDSDGSSVEESETSDCKKTDSAGTSANAQRSTEPVSGADVGADALGENEMDEEETEGTSRKLEGQHDGQSDASDIATIASNESKDSEAGELSSSVGENVKTRQKGAAKNAEHESWTEDNDDNDEKESDAASGDGTIFTKMENAGTSSEKESDDEKDRTTSGKEEKVKQFRSKKPKDSSKKKPKKKEKRKEKKTKSRKSASKKRKSKRNSDAALGKAKRASVPLDTLDETSAHDTSHVDPQQSETTLSMLLTSIEQSHLTVASKSNQTVGEYSAGSFISDTGWSDGTSSSYTDEEENSLSSSDSAKVDPTSDERVEEPHKDNFKRNSPNQHLAVEQSEELPVAPVGVKEKLATTHIVKRLFTKNKYDSLEEEDDAAASDDEGQKSSSFKRESTTATITTSTTTTNHRKSFKIVANLFRPRKNQATDDEDSDPQSVDIIESVAGIQGGASRQNEGTIAQHEEGEVGGSQEVGLNEGRIDKVNTEGIAVAVMQDDDDGKIIWVKSSQEDDPPNMNEGQKASPSNQENHRKSSLNLLVNLFRAKKNQKQDAAETRESSTEVEENVGDAKEKETANDIVPEVENGVDDNLDTTPKTNINQVLDLDEIADGGDPTFADSFSILGEDITYKKEENIADQEEGEAISSQEVEAREESVDKVKFEGVVVETPVVQEEDRNIEGKSPKEDYHPSMPIVDRNNNTGTDVHTREKHETNSKKKDGQGKKKKHQILTGNRVQSESMIDDSNSSKVSRKKEKDGGATKRRSGSDKKRRKSTANLKDKDSFSAGQETKSVSNKKKTRNKSTRISRVTAESCVTLSEEQDKEEEKPSKAKTKRKSQAA